MYRFATATALAALMIGSAAEAAKPAASGDQNPDWLRRPRPEDLLAVWPKDAWRKGLSGKAAIGCDVNLQGVLYNCVVLKEEPSGEGFGRAAIALTPQLLMRPGLKDGQPVKSSVRIPINFDLGPQGRVAAGDFAFTTPIIEAAILWRVAPDYAEVAAAYPAKARAARVPGHANLSCTFTAEGGLTNCRTVTEEPRGYEFAKAGKALAERFRGPTLLKEGKSIKGVQVQLPITFSPDMLDSHGAVIGQPKWAAVPSGEIMWNSFPATAKQAGVTLGRVVLACVVQQEGKLDGCAVESQEPSNYGFGEAALSMTPYFRLKTWTLEGLPTVGGKIRIPIRYDGETEKTAAAASPPAKP